MQVSVLYIDISIFVSSLALKELHKCVYWRLCIILYQEAEKKLRAFWENKSIHPICARMLNMILETRNWQFPATTRDVCTLLKSYKFAEFKWRAWKFKTLLKMAYITNQKSFQAYSMYSLQSFTILLWSPTLRNCGGLGLHVAELQNGFLFIPPFSSHKGTTAFFISPICSLCFGVSISVCVNVFAFIHP